MVIWVMSVRLRGMASFKDLQVWQRGVELASEIYNLCNKLPANERFGLCSQMQRAAVSIPSNISEGYRRNGRQEFKQYCGIALGSSAELETQLIITQSVYSDINCESLLKTCTEIQKMLTVLIKRL
ncbi:four helix bundle protein [soil metagenome]